MTEIIAAPAKDISSTMASLILTDRSDNEESGPLSPPPPPLEFFRQTVRWMETIGSKEADNDDWSSELQKSRLYKDFHQLIQKVMLSKVQKKNRDYYCNKSVCFLQETAGDDVLNSIWSFCDCLSLSRAMQTCRRFNRSVQVHIEQRLQQCTMLPQRILPSRLHLIRAQEQYHGLDNFLLRHQTPLLSLTPRVPIPTLLLQFAVRLTGVRGTGKYAKSAGEFNGIYHCTASGDNGFVFTKPCRRGSPLQCCMSKKFSGETLYWYISKQVLLDDSETLFGSADNLVPVHHHDPIAIPNVPTCNQYMFWAPLSRITNQENDEVSDASSFERQNDDDLYVYPTQSLRARRTGQDGWQSFFDEITPPTVEILLPPYHPARNDQDFADDDDDSGASFIVSEPEDEEAENDNGYYDDNYGDESSSNSHDSPSSDDDDDSSHAYYNGGNFDEDEVLDGGR